MIGNFHLTAAGARASMKRNRGGEFILNPTPQSTQSTLTGESLGTNMKAINSMASDSEYGEGRRAKNYSVRLHSAKYLKMDPLFKELFFPIQNYGRNFGFCSTTGGGSNTAALDGLNESGGGYRPSDNIAFAKANGCWRGLAAFTIRSDKMSDSDAYKLNSSVQNVATDFLSSSSGQTVYSAYRRFNNGPPSVTADSGNIAPGSSMTAMQTLQWSAPSAGETDFNQSHFSISEVGNLLDIENNSVHASNFTSSIGSGTHNEGTSASGINTGQSEAGNWNGTGSIVTGDNYYPNLNDTVFRIADGQLTMDITNGKNSSCLVELVIHSQSKQVSDFTPQRFYNEVFQACEYQQKQSRDPSVTGGNLNGPGGWQAFYDPEYPLLSLKSAYKKPCDSMMREVHRSAHMLAPGQSKKISISLGSLYYTPAGKSDTGYNNRMRQTKTDFNAGTLLITLGHSGVSQLTMPSRLSDGNTTAFSVLPDEITNDQGSVTHSFPGAGFWIGKQKAPSEIIVQGRYTEKYYPTYVISKTRYAANDNVLLPPYTLGSGSTRYTLPAGLPVQQTLGVTDSDTTSLSAKVATSTNN